jgi:cobalt-zinc-cadmium efflux system outer membrane protein
MRTISFGAGTLLLLILLSGCGAVKTDREWARLEEATADFTDQRILWEQSDEDEAKIEEEINRVLKDNVLTRNEAVEIVLINNRALQSAFEEIGISRADLVQAGLFHNPSLGMLFRFPFDGDGTNIELEGGFALSDLWQMPFRRKVAAAQMDVTIMRVSKVVLDTLMEVKLAYEKVYYLNLERDEVQKMLEKSEEISKETEKRRNFGFMSDLEVYLSQSLVSRVEMDLAGTEAEINIARAHLDRVLGIGLKHPDYEIEEDGNELPEMPDLNAALQYALDHRPDVQIARLRIKESERALRLEKTRILKYLDLSASYEKDGEGSEAFGPGVDLQIPIFDQNRASIAKLSYMVRKAERDLQALEGQIKEEIAVDLERIRLYKTKTMTYQEKTIPLNQKAIEYVEEWVGAMQLSRLYLLETQKELLQSQKDYLEALMELRHTFLDLERHLGGSLP